MLHRRQSLEFPIPSITGVVGIALDPVVVRFETAIYIDMISKFSAFVLSNNNIETLQSRFKTMINSSECNLRILFSKLIMYMQVCIMQRSVLLLVHWKT